MDIIRQTAHRGGKTADEMLHNVFEASRLERLQIQQAAESSRELPMIQPR
ncbi:MAG: hypothetical protein HP493_07995 [Nitrospira sp.]|nr:hypothetical protein [Nitrospira sp.]